jgi:hypothetical protein
MTLMKKINLCTIVLCSFLLLSCNKESSEESLCDMIKASFNVISIAFPDPSCDSEPGTTTFNEHGQMKSFTTVVTCGSTIYSIRVYNITYDSAGDVCSYDATVNGQSCHWDKP